MHRGLWSFAFATYAVCVASACGDSPGARPSGEPLDATRVEPATAIDEPIVVIGETLLAQAPSDDGIEAMEADRLLRSADGGRTWAPVPLPGDTGGVAYGSASPSLVGDVVVVTGRQIVESFGFTVDAGDAYVWTSADGEDWHGERLTGAGPAFDETNVFAAGDVLLATVQTGDVNPLAGNHRLEVFRSDDGGRSWAAAALPHVESVAIGAWETDDGRLLLAVQQPPTGQVLASDDGGRTWSLAECPVATVTCADPAETGGLAVRSGNDGEPLVSVDGGATWQPIVVDPEPASLARPYPAQASAG